jgi:hypothetical protein
MLALWLMTALGPGCIRYRYYVSLPCLHGETATAKVGSVTRVPATDIEDVVVRSLNEYLTSQGGMPASTITGHGAIAEMIDRIDIHKDRLAVRLSHEKIRGQLSRQTISNRPTIASCPFPGGSHHPKDSGKSCCPMALRETMSGRSGPNAASVWSAPSHEADAGWTR